MISLDGIRIIDLSRVLADPYCAQLLADFGATVIKVAGPKGDENRRWPPLNTDGQSSNFGSVNRGKRNLVLNLKTPAAHDLLYQLAKREVSPVRHSIRWIR
jgi:crotonobetainyl-CoA:carnitine CoA-transferase CaiB-like acyl-CoA transferase